MVTSNFPSLNDTLPLDADHAVLIGRIWVPGEGPYLVKVGAHETTDLSALALTSSDLMELELAARRSPSTPAEHGPRLQCGPIQTHPITTPKKHGSWHPQTCKPLKLQG